MLTKMITFILTFSIFTTQALASSHDGLKAAFDEYQYSVTVEWNQEDESFLNTKKEEFAAAVAALEASGMKRAELVEFTKSQLKDARLIADFEAVLNAVALDQMSAEEAQGHMLEAIEKAPASGTSWRPSVIGSLFAVFGIAVISGLIYVNFIMKKEPAAV